MVNYRHSDMIVGKIELEEPVEDLIKAKFGIDIICCFSYIDDGTIVPSGYGRTKKE